MFSEVPINPPVVERINAEWCSGINLKVLRLDLVHPHLGGNKVFKLLPNIYEAKRQAKHTLLSFGGAYSNHLRALAAAGKLYGLKTVGFVRGEIVRPLNPVLEFAHDQGMELIPLTRSDYRSKHTDTLLNQIRNDFDDPYIIPEGGSNVLGARGCMEIAKFLPGGVEGKKREVILACGTGATMSGLVAGIRAGAASDTRVIGVSVLKAPAYIENEVRGFVGELSSSSTDCPAEWQVLDDFHCGGYAKTNDELTSFITEWKSNNTVPIEPVYTGKMFLAIKKLCAKGLIAKGSEVIALHTGGVY